MWKRTRKAERGFTLLEIVVALALIATALVAVLRLHARNLDLQHEAQFLTTARFLAQERISRLAARAELSERDDTGDFGDGFPGYRFEEAVSRVDDLEGLYQVKVSVRRDLSEDRKQMDIQTYLYRPEP